MIRSFFFFFFTLSMKVQTKDNHTSNVFLKAYIVLVSNNMNGYYGKKVCPFQNIKIGQKLDDLFCLEPGHVQLAHTQFIVHFKKYIYIFI